MFQATRRRLALWYTAVTAVLLLLFATGVYLYVRSTLIERIDDTLNHVVEVVERSLVIESASSDTDQFRINIEATFRDNADTVEDDHIDLEWFSPTGELLWSTLSEPLDIPLHPNRTGETVQIVRGKGAGELEESDDLSPLVSRFLPPSRLRQVTERVQNGRQVIGYLRVSHPWFEVTKPIRQLVVDLSLGTGLMVLSVAASGWFLSGKAMEPVRESYQRLKQFTADASHELRSPITLIQTNVQVALADPDLLALSDSAALQYRQQLKVVERLTKRLGRLVDDLLFLARQDSGIVKPQFSPCPLDALLMEVIEEQQLVAVEKKITLSLDLVEPSGTETAHASSGEELISHGSLREEQVHPQLSPRLTPELVDSWFTLQGDWNQLARLFTNLIGNAVQYTPAGGQVKVKLQRITIGKVNSQARSTGQDARGRISPLASRLDARRLASATLSPLASFGASHLSPLVSRLQVVVSDTGIGIPESGLPHLFDRFYRVDPARTHAATTPTVEMPTGSGLGLAIAAAIVENHQGQIQVESSLDRGTTFTVTLPLNVEF
jgi:OmpR-family two-component system manganese-sensing sensor histidine kinase